MPSFFGWEREMFSRISVMTGWFDCIKLLFGWDLKSGFCQAHSSKSLSATRAINSPLVGFSLGE